MVNFFDTRLRPSDWRKIQPCAISGCWLWVGAQLPNGYGSVGVIGRGDISQLAHRYVYTQLVGVIPDGLHIDHRCRVRCCVNPLHLEAVTRQVNNERAAKVKSANCTQCPQGHVYGPGNEKRAGGCRTCHNDTSRQLRRNWKLFRIRLTDRSIAELDALFASVTDEELAAIQSA